MDDALQRKLDRIARRQWYILVLLLYPYLAAGAWFATENAILAATAPVVVIVVAAYLVTLVRARSGSGERETDSDSATE